MPPFTPHPSLRLLTGVKRKAKHMARKGESREERVAQLKACASEIIDRAEELIGNNEYSAGYTISIELYAKESPIVRLERKIIPFDKLNAPELY
jgi:hypothetical protein